jgi:hypothetical protein
MTIRVLALCTALFAACAGAAVADPVRVNATLTANFLDGVHNTGVTTDRITLVPIPLASVDARWRALSLHLEGLPSVTFGYGPNGENAQSTRLSLLNPALRYAITPQTFIGLGQTIYNQATYYGGVNPLVVGVAQEQYSRVTGIRYEIGHAIRLSATTHLDGTFAINPAMQGLEYSVVAFGRSTRILADPEVASQIDTVVNIEHRTKHGAFIYGLRYLNYAAKYRATGTPFNGKLSDQNTGFLPTIGYRF